MSFTRTINQKLWDRLYPDPDTGCLLWTGPLNPNGRASVYYKGRKQMIYRVAWQEVRGDIPTGMYVCHKCDVPCCCNVEHLFLGTPSDNMADMWHKGRNKSNPELQKKHIPRGDAHRLRRHPELIKRGEDVPWTVLTTAQVQQIRQLRDEGKFLSMIATKFNTTAANIHNIVTRKTWRHVA